VYTPSPSFSDWDGAPYSTHLIELRSEVTAALETSRNAKHIGSSLEAKVILTLTVEDEGLAGAYAKAYPKLLEELCLTSDFEIRWGGLERSVKIEVLSWNKCPRCWKLTPEVLPDHLCQRCNQVFQALQ
jgi:isoleucyl-tRNA synthetase